MEPAKAAAAPLARLDALPADVAFMIFSHIPALARLRTLARVNKRLRELVHLSVRELHVFDTLAPGSCERVATLSSLASLTLHNYTAPLQLPPTLRTLRLYMAPLTTYPLWAPLPPLTSLSVSGEAERKGLCRLLTQLTSSLQHLELRILPEKDELVPYMATARFPALRSFAFNGNELNMYEEFLLAHAPQLEELAIDAPDDLVPPAVASSRLRSLTWRTMRAPPADLLALCPNLTALHVAYLAAQLPQSLVPLVRTAGIAHWLTEEGPANIVCGLPNVTSLRVPLSAETAPIYRATHRAELVTYCNTVESTDTALLAGFTRITKLKLGCSDGLATPQALDPNLSLPCVTTLVMDAHESHEPLRAFIALVEHVAALCPRLRRVKLKELECPLTAADVPALVRFVTALERRTVELLLLEEGMEGNGKFARAVQELVRPLPLCWLTVRARSHLQKFTLDP